jgi:Ca2+-binding RTX toxin-like protein
MADHNPHSDAADSNDPDWQGDLNGQAPNGNEDPDDRVITPPGPPPPPPVPPTPPVTAAPSVPGAFASFVDGLPGSFVQAMMAATVNGTPWTPVVVSAAPYDIYPLSQPSLLFADIASANAPLMDLTGNNVVGLISDGTAPLTVVDTATPFQYVASGDGGMTLFAQSANGAFVAEGGSNIVVTGAKHVGSWTFTLEGGTNQIWANAGNNIITTAASGQDTIGLGGGNNLVSSAGQDMIIGGSGNDTVDATGTNDTIFGGSGSMTFINASTVAGAQSNIVAAGSGMMTVEGGAGSITAWGGTGGGIFYGGSAGNNLLVGSSGPVTLVGGGNGDQLYGGPGGGDQLVASVGNETLLGGSGGNNTIWGGTGNDLIVLTGGTNNTVVGGTSGNDTIWAGAGSDVISLKGANADVIAGAGGMDTINAGSGNYNFLFINGQAGGVSVINNFNPSTDQIDLINYAANPDTVTSAAGSTTIALSDHTQIILTGVSHLPSGAIT